MKNTIIKKKEKDEIKRIHIFTHTDLDGVGSGLMLEGIFDKAETKIIYCNYSKMEDNINKFIKNKYYENVDLIFITDLSFTSKEVADKLDKFCREKVVMLDHHKTTEIMDIYDWVNISVEVEGVLQSGTSLVYTWAEKSGFLDDLQNIFKYNLKKFSEIVRMYDSWDWSKEESELADLAYSLNELFYLKGAKQFAEEFKTRELDITLDVEDMAMLKALKLKYNQLLRSKNSQMKRITVKGIDENEYQVGLVFADSNTSELGNDLSKANLDMDLIMLINMNTSSISYRTAREDVDVTNIAKRFGGGGHVKASGSKLTHKFMLEILEKTGMLE